MPPTMTDGRSHVPDGRSREVAATTARPAPPTTMRMAPTVKGLEVSGPNACAVPVVPHSAAASSTKMYPRWVGTVGD